MLEAVVRRDGSSRFGNTEIWCFPCSISRMESLTGKFHGINKKLA